MSLYNYGHKPDKVDASFGKASSRYASANVPPEYTGLEWFVRRVRNQGATSSCVGHAVASAIDVRLRKLGHDKPEPSALGIYTIARTFERKDAVTPLRDVGSYPSDAMRGANEWGAPTEAAWPLKSASVNKELKLGALLSANAGRIDSFWRVDSTGTARVADVCAALAKGIPCVFATQVDGAFEANRGEVIGKRTGDILGGHMLLLIGYRTNAAGKREFRGLNSWGTAWGDKGFFWMHEDRITQSGTTDIYALEIQP